MWQNTMLLCSGLLSYVGLSWILLQYVHLNCCMDMPFQHKMQPQRYHESLYGFEKSTFVLGSLAGTCRSRFLVMYSHTGQQTCQMGSALFMPPQDNDHQSCAFLTGPLSSVFTSEVILYILCTNL